LYQILYENSVAALQVERIAALARIHGKRGGQLRLLVDHQSQISFLKRIFELSGYPPYVYIDIDLGDNFSGVLPASAEFQHLFSQIEQIVLQDGPTSLAFVGFYCSAVYEDAYYGSLEALETLEKQLSILLHASPVQGIRLSLNITPAILHLSDILTNDRDEELAQKHQRFKIC
jgi:hypothetical protein